MNDRKEQFRQLEAAASGRWQDIIQALSCVDMSTAIATKKHVRCHRDHGRTKQQFRVFPDFDRKGGGICNSCGAFPNGFLLLTYLNGWDLKQAVKEVAHYLKGNGQLGTPCKLPPPKPKTWEVSEKKLKTLRRIWQGTKRLGGSLGEKYLRNRGVTCDIPDEAEIRFHPRLGYWNEDGKFEGYHPGIVSLIRTAEAGEPITLHRTYIDKDGKKANVGQSKKLMSAAIDGAITELGGAIRLFPINGDTLSVTEGIETALAIRSAHPDTPVWACYSAQVLTNFRPPKGVKKVIVWGDIDPKGAGQIAAAKLAIRLEKRGLRAEVKLPSSVAINVPADRNIGWFSKDEPRTAIVECLEANGYNACEFAGRQSRDWLDEWNAKKESVIQAVSAKNRAA